MAFDYFHFDGLLADIEERLGYLKGNELGWQYLLDARAQLGGEEAPGDDYTPARRSLEDFRFPVPGHEWGPHRLFQFTFWVPNDVLDDNYDEVLASHEQYMKEVASGARTAWENGASWASGLRSYCHQVCDSFTRPDADNIITNVDLLHTHVTSDFSINVLDDWAGLGGIESDWDSEGGRRFQSFYTNYDGQIGQMAYFSVQVAQTFAAAAQVIHGTQQGVIAFAESVIEILDEALASWALVLGPPPSPPDTPAWIADVTAISKEGWDVLGHVPVVKDVKGQIDGVISAGKDVREFAIAIADATGTDLPHFTTTVSDADSDGVYELLTTTLYDDYQQKYVAAMDSLRTGTSGDPEDPTYKPPINTDDVRGDLPPLGWFPQAQVPRRDVVT